MDDHIRFVYLHISAASVLDEGGELFHVECVDTNMRMPWKVRFQNGMRNETNETHVT